MTTRDLRNAISPANSLSPAARTASANGTGVDLQGFESVAVIVQFGAYTDGTHTPSLQESSDNTNFTNVAAADQGGTFTAVNGAGGANTVQEVGYLGTRRYIRVVMTVASATTGALSNALIVRGHATQMPAA